MKTTLYFKYTRTRPDRALIKDEWIYDTVKNPDSSAVQSDGRTRFWKKIDAVDKYLRVIVLEDGETIHNAFFDRGFKENSHED